MQAIISWAMLELLAHPVLDTSLLLGAGVWGRDETVQIIPDALDNDGLFRIWAAMQIKYRLCATFKARVVRIGLGSAPDALPVIARRLGFAEADVLEPA